MLDERRSPADGHLQCMRPILAVGDQVIDCRGVIESRSWRRITKVGQKDSKQSALDQHEARSTFVLGLDASRSFRSVPQEPAFPRLPPLPV